MIRAETNDGWILITHQDHARLAGEFARAWGNEVFAAPEPRAAIITAVSRHDDGWIGRDAKPSLTPEGKPSAFTKELVGAYSAFEEVGLEDYLRVRGEATEAVAKDNPYSAILVSMHTHNLLTKQMDVSTLSPASRPLHKAFVDGQEKRQKELAASIANDPVYAAALRPAALERAFKFLQWCDNLSLLACSAYPKQAKLRHAHPARDGSLKEFLNTPNEPAAAGYAVDFAVTPYPFGVPVLEFEIPARFIPVKTFTSDEDLGRHFRAAAVTKLKGRITK